MFPRHLRWDEFIQRLGGPEACNFQNDQWTCFGDVRFINRILREMGLDTRSTGVSVAYFRDHGAYCDCEVVFMADRAR
jgi:Protein of unknown function (DUF2695)